MTEKNKTLIAIAATAAAAAGIGVGVAANTGPIANAQVTQAVAVQTLATQNDTKVLTGKGYRIDIAKKGGRNYQIKAEYQRGGKTKNDTLTMEAARVSAISNAVSLGIQVTPEQVSTVRDFIPLARFIYPNGTTEIELQPTPTGTLTPPSVISPDGYGKWDNLTCQQSAFTGNNPRTATVTCSNGRVATVGLTNQQYSNVGSDVQLTIWMEAYIKANSRVTPTPVGAWWDNGVLPTNWSGHGAMKYVYSDGWVFIYMPNAPIESGRVRSEFDMSQLVGNAERPTDEQTAYAMAVMQGAISLQP